MIAPGGTFGAFRCAGMGSSLVWKVDGQLLHHLPNQNRRIIEATTSSSGTVQSSLTVPATSVNNGTTVQCGVRPSFSSPLVFSSNSTLTVLPGEFCTKMRSVVLLKYYRVYSVATTTRYPFFIA